MNEQEADGNWEFQKCSQSSRKCRYPQETVAKFISLIVISPSQLESNAWPLLQNPCLYGHRYVLGAWVVGTILANPFRKLCALVFYLCHCSYPREKVSCFRATSKPRYNTHMCAHTPPLGRHCKRLILVAPHVHLTAVQIKGISFCAGHLILQIIPTMTYFLNLLLSYNIHVEMYTHKRLTQQISKTLHILI